MMDLYTIATSHEDVVQVTRSLNVFIDWDSENFDSLQIIYEEGLDSLESLQEKLKTSLRIS